MSAAQIATDDAHAHKGRHPGRLDLRLECGGQRTRPLRCLAEPPIQLSRVRYDDPDDPSLACFTLLHLGGILSGDRLHQRVEVAAGARARITMAAATQVLAMPTGDAELATELQLAPHSRLEWLAEPLILFGDSCLRQSLHIRLAPGARLDLLEVLVPGRLARGEQYRFRSYQSEVEIGDESGRCLSAERAVLEPARRTPARPGILGNTPVLGSLFILGDSVDAERMAAQLTGVAPDVAAMVLPGKCGLLVRLLGAWPTAVRQRLLQLRTLEG